MYRIAISDDNKDHLCELHRFVCEIMKEKIQSITEFSSSMDIEEYIEQNGFPFDIVLMDIKYSDENNTGIDIATLIHKVSPCCQIIFVTSYIRFATDIFDVDHTYLVMKTEMRKRLPDALERAEKNIARLRTSVICINNKGVSFVLNTNDILYLERIRRITQVVTEDNIYTCYEPLESMLERIDLDTFIQTHKSYAVNITKIHVYHKNSLTLSNSKIIPISRAHWKQTHDAFMKYIGNSI